MKEKPIKCYDHIVDMKLEFKSRFRIEDESKMLGSKIIKLKDWSTKNSPSYANVL